MVYHRTDFNASFYYVPYNTVVIGIGEKIATLMTTEALTVV